MKDFTVIIPARLSSTRLPEKMIADIGGKALIVRTAEAAKKSQASRVVVAADDEKIVRICQEHDVDVVLTDKNHESGTNRLAEAANMIRLPENHAVINVQGDEPMINPQIIDDLADYFLQQNLPMATVAHAIEHIEEFHNPNIVKTVLDKNHLALYFSRAPIPFPRESQGLPHQLSVLRHIGIYAYRVSFLNTYQNLAPSPLEQTEMLEQLRVLWHGLDIGVLVTAIIPPAGVDTAEDLQRVRNLWDKI
ncbi:MAG: 3-deoxy-manno-octulosonate cytidylyltransferase [Neisseriaceae bacterium]|nr:3-deoxy-manno-octulosonate cytidylyltransferase [Neisseriaceae bacterium]MBO7380437.1 3-deoxy-manno-octulosonate cytidylyltransferase [Neisseriaceae bacterium]